MPSEKTYKKGDECMMLSDATQNGNPLFCSQKRHTKKQKMVADATKSHPLLCSSEKTYQKEITVPYANESHSLSLQSEKTCKNSKILSPKTTKVIPLKISSTLFESEKSGGCNEMSVPLLCLKLVS